MLRRKSIFYNPVFKALHAMTDSQGKFWFSIDDVIMAVHHPNPPLVIRTMERNPKFTYFDSNRERRRHMMVDAKSMFKIIGESSDPARDYFSYWVRSVVLPEMEKESGRKLDFEYNFIEYEKDVRPQTAEERKTDEIVCAFVTLEEERMELEDNIDRLEEENTRLAKENARLKSRNGKFLDRIRYMESENMEQYRNNINH